MPEPASGARVRPVSGVRSSEHSSASVRSDSQFAKFDAREAGFVHLG